MNHVLKYLFFITFIPSLVWSSGIDTSLMKSIPMQEAGRLKPYDTFARESLMLIYGKSKYKKRPAHEIVMTWFILPEAWSEKPIVQVKRAQLKETLKLEKTRDHFTPNELFANDRLSLAFQELAGKQRLKQKLDPYYQSVQRLQNQLGVFRAITSGMSFRWVPPKDGKEDDKDEWSSLHNSGFPAEAAARFQTLTRNFVGVIGANMRESISEADKKELQKSFDESVVQFMASAKQVAPDKYPSKSEIAREVHYNSLDPFMWSWILYLLGVLLLSVAWYSDGKKTYSAAWVLFSLGLILHTYGFYLRVMIAGRPPVSNMYETVIWVSWGGILFSMMIEAVYKQRYILLGGGIGGILCLVLASLAPTILDASISPLEPVLVSNFWLLIHVLTTHR